MLENEPTLSVRKIAPGMVQIQGDIKAGESVAVTLTDMNGRVLASFVEKAHCQGTCDVTLPLVLSPGIYLIGVQTQDGYVVEKLVW